MDSARDRKWGKRFREVEVREGRRRREVATARKKACNGINTLPDVY
jgi:hypothetical protein